MTNVKTAQQAPKPAGLDTSGLPDFSKSTPSAPSAPAAPTASPKPGAPAAGGLESFMPGSKDAPAAPTGTNPFMPGQKAAPHAGVSGSTPIKKMQAAILHFAEIASSSDVTSMHGNQTGKKEQGDEYLGGSDPFGNFLASRIGETDNRAPENQQYVHTDLKQPQRSTTGIADSSLRGMIDDLRRVGTPGKENQPDGIWKGRTDHALKNIRLIVSELLHLSNDMGITIEGLDEKSVENLRSSFYDNYTKIPPGKAEEMANNLTPQIMNFANVFGNFKKSVLNNPSYRKYIDQQKSFVQYQQKPQSGDELLTPEENKAYAANVNAPVPNVQLAKSPVTLVDLKSLENFKALMTRAGLNPNDATAMQNALNEVAKGLGVAGTPAATPPSQYDPGY